jgi:glycosyltransferase involved in cell wall biosynthesis
MRVLHVIPAVAVRYGGPSQAVFALCAALESEGVRAVIATTDADGPGRLAVEIGRAVPFNGIDTVFFRRQWSEGVKFSAGLAGWLRTRASGFDVLHIHAVFSHSSIAAATAARRAGVPYVVRPLGSLSSWALRQKRLRKRLLWRVAVRRMLEGAAVVHYTTESERAQAEGALGIRRGVVIPHGVDGGARATPAAGARFRRSHPALGERPYVLFLGRLDPVKGVESLIESFLDAGDGDRGDEWRLVISGDGDPAYRRTLESLVMRRGGGGRVVFTGWLDGDAKDGALAEAAVLAQPSLQESFGLSLVEAMAAGCPVILPAGLDLASTVEAAGAGWIVPPGAGRLTDAIVAATGSNSERRRRGAAGRQLVAARFSWAGAARRLKDLYSSLITVRASAAVV